MKGWKEGRIWFGQWEGKIVLRKIRGRRPGPSCYSQRNEMKRGEGGGAGGKKVYLCSEKGLGWKGGG